MTISRHCDEAVQEPFAQRDTFERDASWAQLRQPESISLSQHRIQTLKRFREEALVATREDRRDARHAFQAGNLSEFDVHFDTIVGCQLLRLEALKEAKKRKLNILQHQLNDALEAEISTGR